MKLHKNLLSLAIIPLFMSILGCKEPVACRKTLTYEYDNLYFNCSYFCNENILNELEKEIRKQLLQGSRIGLDSVRKEYGDTYNQIYSITGNTKYLEIRGTFDTPKDCLDNCRRANCDLQHDSVGYAKDSGAIIRLKFKQDYNNQTKSTYKKSPRERCQKYCNDTFSKGTETWNNCMYDTCKDMKDD